MAGRRNLGFFPPFLFWFLSDVFVIWLWFFYWRIEQGQAHLSNTLTMSGKPTKNFLGVSEKKFRLKSEVLSEYSSVIPASFFKISTFFAFPVVRSLFVYWQKWLGQSDLPDTLDMFVKLTKHFLETLFKKFQLKTWGFVRIYSNLVLSFMFHVLSWKFFQVSLENVL